jgi:hypothetical protein
MQVTPNNLGWSVSNEGPWHLIHNGSRVLSLVMSNGHTSTQATLFVGTKEECLAEIIRLGILYSPLIGEYFENSTQPEEILLTEG